MAASTSCPRFVQNAWKRDLCSNCFKAKEDHAPVVDNRARYLANLKEITKRPPPPSILKGIIRKNVAAIKVHFPTEESQVIGYGGDDEFSDAEDEDDFCTKEKTKAPEDSVENEEDKNFQKLTEFNTQFNMDPENLRIDSKPKPTEAAKKTTASTPLKLGQAQSNSDGKKQPLLVSVQPFGSAANATPLAVSRKTHLNNLLHDTTDSLKLSEVAEAKTVITTPPSTKPAQEDKTDIGCEDVPNNVKISLPEAQHVNNVIVDSQPESVVDNSSSTITDSAKQDCDSDKKTEKQAENRLSALIEGKKTQITRGTILTKTHEQAKAKRFFQLGPVKPDEELPVSESLYKKFDSKDIKSFSKAKDTISMKSLHQKNAKNLTNGLFSSKLMKKEFGIQSDLQLTRMKSLEFIDVKSNNQGVGEESGKKNKRDSLPSDVMVNFASVLPAERTDKDEVFIIDGVPAESREMVGEPDGKADSDDLDDPPPDLPTTPPPLITDHIPRPSFLHNINKDKPKLPVKPKNRDDSPSPPRELVLDPVQLDSVAPDPNLSPGSRHSLITKRQAPKPPPTPTPSTPPSDSPTKFTRPPSEEGSPRERASSCSPLPSESESTGGSGSQADVAAQRRSLSLSHEALACVTPSPAMDKKKGNKMRSTIRKFLRLASREELKCEELGPPPLPPPRPRPEIIHPLDLNKSAVQVLRGDGSLVASGRNGSVELSSSPTSPVSPNFHGRPSKPPPPPRSQSLDSGMGVDCRPARPPPPQLTPQRSPPTDSVYVNLGEPDSGEVRSLIAPAKPQRTASLREKDSVDSVYQQTPPALQMTENLYECLAPECDLNRDRSSLPYYGSETESDIYCPYTFANSLKGGEEGRPCKGRSVVHKNLEDNYGAVIVANHEALTQLLELVSQAPVVPPVLRPLKACSNLQWSDFALSGGEVRVGGRVFLSAEWTPPTTTSPVPVSLCLSPGQARLPPSFAPIMQFFDLVASQYLNQDKTELVQVSVAVMVRQDFFSFAGFVTQLSSSADAVRESALLLVQTVSCVKSLQAQGREEASLAHLVVCRESGAAGGVRVCLLPQDNDKAETVSLCRCAVQAVESLPLPQPLAAILRSVLGEERATSLSQAKAVLELWLWGPTHIPASADTQACLQRWLDLERATVLQSLVVRRPLFLPPSDYCHLSFLVRTNAKSMADALTLLDPSTSPSVNTSSA